jgi:hypothetical protein
MRTKAWLSFFHRMRFFPEREKQNERYFGKVEPWLSEDATDLAGLGAFGVLVGVWVLAAVDELMKCEKIPSRFVLLKGVVGMLPPRAEGSICLTLTSGSGGLYGRKEFGTSPEPILLRGMSRPGVGVPDVIIICRVLVMTC